MCRLGVVGAVAALVARVVIAIMIGFVRRLNISTLKDASAMSLVDTCDVERESVSGLLYHFRLSLSTTDSHRRLDQATLRLTVLCLRICLRFVTDRTRFLLGNMQGA